MLWFRSLKGFSVVLVLVGLALLSEPNLTITLRELGGIFIIIGGIAYVLARGALGFTRRTLKLLALLAIVPTAAAQERIISKPDADMIFAFTRADWERYVRQVAPPEGWTLRLQPHDTGTVLGRFNRSTGIGTSVQPLFMDDQGPPRMLVVGSYYPPGVMRITDEVVKKIEQAARLDLGPAYSVLANHAELPGTPNLEAIELIVTRDTIDPRGPKTK